ncbi:MAG: hypothetical protein ACK5SU_00920, partial [Phenylobacterium sp.]
MPRPHPRSPHAQAPAAAEVYKIPPPHRPIADMAIWPWYGAMAKGELYGGGEFLQVQEYVNVNRWADAIAARPAVKRGRAVNRPFGKPESQLLERHDASDFDKLVL